MTTLETLKSKLTPQQSAALDDAIITAKVVIQSIESGHPTTKDYYGDYLSFIKDQTTALIFVLAGGNRAGIIAAAQINGVM